MFAPARRPTWLQLIPRSVARATDQLDPSALTPRVVTISSRPSPLAACRRQRARLLGPDSSRIEESQVMWQARVAPVLSALIVSVIYTSIGPGHAESGSSLEPAREDSFYQCRLPFTSVYPSLIQISIHVMSFVQNGSQANAGPHGGSANQTEVIGTDEGDFILKQIEHNSTWQTLEAVGLNASLPFVFFINGFLSVDAEGNIKGTWMHGVAQSYARRKIRNNQEQENKKNVVFITWSLPSFWDDNIMNVIPAYYKTMAYYGRILDSVSGTIQTMIGFVEGKRDRGWPSSEFRQSFYRRFQFFGHSLGAHLITDAVLQTHQSMPEVKFGKLMGLDPANPCFLSLEHGLSLKRMADTVDQLVVLHSNAGFAGLASERADVEIVLNGGTFQPGCSWINFSCNHARAVDVLRYIDDECQMVAYKCSGYQHFKLGACETCDSHREPSSPFARLQSDAIRDRSSASCVLVNLPEQHRDSDEILALIDNIVDEDGDGYDDNDRIRHLADNELSRTSNKTSLNGEPARAKGTRTMAGRGTKSAPSGQADTSPTSETTEQATRYNHYVNTNPKFRTGPKTHCLQHYQLRLLINYQDDKLQRNCPLGRFFDGKLRLDLFHETMDRSQSSALRYDDGAPAKSRFGSVIDDTLYTSLLNYAGKPKLFVGALVNNIDLAKLSRCLKARAGDNSSPRELKFVLDIAFMSHVNEKVRHTFSSVLCGRWNTTSQVEDGLVLSLCRQAELANVSSQLDTLLDKIKDEQFYESWKVSLLNNLFSLFVQWEPF